MTGPEEIGGYIGSLTAKIFFWATLAGGTLLAAVFSASLLEPRRTTLLFSQPISRADYAQGIWAATCTLAVATHAFFTLLAWLSLRFLEVKAPATLLLTPLVWVLAFGAVLALQLLAGILFRSALFTGIVGFGVVWGIAILGSFRRAHAGELFDRGLGLLYAVLPRGLELMDQSARIAEGKLPRLASILPTVALLVAYLLVVRVAVQRSER